MLLFASAVPGRPGELRLVAPDAQVHGMRQARHKLRAILAELLAPDAPARITGVREAIHVAGKLAGEGETQMFLATARRHRRRDHRRPPPGRRASWGVSFSEVAEAGSRAAARNAALVSPRLLPAAALPRGVNLSDTAQDRAWPMPTIALVMAALGPCPRLRR